MTGLKKAESAMAAGPRQRTKASETRDDMIAKAENPYIVEVWGCRYTTRFEGGDGPRRYDESDPVEVDLAYRLGALEAAQVIGEWSTCNLGAATDALCEFSRVKQAATEVSFDGYEAYRLGHAVDSAKARGRHATLDRIAEQWDRFLRAGYSDDDVLALVHTWCTEFARWLLRRFDGDRAISAAPDLSEPVRRPESEAEDDAPPWTIARSVPAMVGKMRQPVVHGLLRESETMNLVAAPKTGKSWMALDLAMSVAAGKPWLGRFETERGSALIIDNELHIETIHPRIEAVAAARGMKPRDYADRLHICALRSLGGPPRSLGRLLDEIVPGQFSLIVLDAFYRFLPTRVRENDNTQVARFYKDLNTRSEALRCAFVLVHHANKGSQWGKEITDVGAGAGVQSRATDTHLVLRPQRRWGVAVMEVASRSWSPIEPIAVVRDGPLWSTTHDYELDPKGRVRKASDSTASSEGEAAWTAGRFVAEVIEARSRRPEILLNAIARGLSDRHAKRLLAESQEEGLIRRLPGPANKPAEYEVVSPT